MNDAQAFEISGHRSIPWTVTAFAAIQVLSAIIWVALRWNGNLWTVIAPNVISAAIIIGLLMRNRGAWFVGAFFAALGAIGTLGFLLGWMRSPAEMEARNVVSVPAWALSSAMLFHPTTRAWIFGDGDGTVA